MDDTVKPTDPLNPYAEKYLLHGEIPSLSHPSILTPFVMQNRNQSISENQPPLNPDHYLGDKEPPEIERGYYQEDDPETPVYKTQNSSRSRQRLGIDGTLVETLRITYKEPSSRVTAFGAMRLCIQAALIQWRKNPREPHLTITVHSAHGNYLLAVSRGQFKRHTGVNPKLFDRPRRWKQATEKNALEYIEKLQAAGLFRILQNEQDPQSDSESPGQEPE